MTSTSTTAPILNRNLAVRPWRLPRARSLPGIAPVSLDDWLWQLDSYPAQMAERERLLQSQPDKVHGLQADALAPARELYDLVLGILKTRVGFCREEAGMRCPDGRVVPLDRGTPLMTLGRLVQEDFCILQRKEGQGEHLLTGAILCFPASWTLAEKLGRPMMGIHVPVKVYDSELGRRVQRLLDGIQPGRPLSRSNAFFYDDPALFQPRPENDPRPAGGPEAPYYVRSGNACSACPKAMRLPSRSIRSSWSGNSSMRRILRCSGSRGFLQAQAAKSCVSISGGEIGLPCNSSSRSLMAPRSSMRTRKRSPSAVANSIPSDTANPVARRCATKA